MSVSTSSTPNGFGGRLFVTRLIGLVIQKLNTPLATIVICIFIPLGFGLWSWLFGMDSNWDLRNYHLYNAFAFLNDKLSIDFAVAGFQSYFNPLLDLPYFYAITHLPPQLVGFLYGVLHGLNFIVVLVICRTVLRSLPASEKNLITLCLAAAGCVTVNFLSSIGNTMGDNTTSLFCLSSVALVLHSCSFASIKTKRSLQLICAAGLLMGMGTGLKLTNAIYAVALCASLPFGATSPKMKVRMIIAFGVSVLAGMALTAGFWFYRMWQTFGNPLFPQFGNIFPNPIARNISVADTTYLPKSIFEQFIWPVLISLDAHRVSELNLRQIIWALFYFLCIGLLIRSASCRFRGLTSPQMAMECRVVISTVVVAFIVWMKLFSIYRYLVPAELLLPLAIFILCQHLFSYSRAKWLAGILISIASAVVLLGGFKGWGHERWAREAFQVEVPALADPSHTSVLITQGNPPLAWIAAAFPATVAFAQVDGGFPKGPKYTEHIRQRVVGRNGPAFALIQGYQDDRILKALEVQANVARFRLTKSAAGCFALEIINDKLRWPALFKAGSSLNEQDKCTLDFDTLRKPIDIAQKNANERGKSARILTQLNLSLKQETCIFLKGGIGASDEIFQWCAVNIGSAN